MLNALQTSGGKQEQLRGVECTGLEVSPLQPQCRQKHRSLGKAQPRSRAICFRGRDLFRGMGQPLNVLHFSYSFKGSSGLSLCITCRVDWHHENFPELSGDNCFCHLDLEARTIQRVVDESHKICSPYSAPFRAQIKFDFFHEATHIPLSPSF